MSKELNPFDLPAGTDAKGDPQDKQIAISSVIEILRELQSVNEALHFDGHRSGEVYLTVRDCIMNIKNRITK